MYAIPVTLYIPVYVATTLPQVILEIKNPTIEQPAKQASHKKKPDQVEAFKNSASITSCQHIPILPINHVAANFVLVSHLQEELFMIQKQFTEIEYLAFRHYHKLKKNLTIHNPPVDICRSNGDITSINWQRLSIVLSKLSVYSIKHENERPLGNKANKAIHWLKHILTNPKENRLFKPRDVFSRQRINSFCAQAIASQNVRLLPMFKTELSSLGDIHFLNDENAKLAYEYPTLFKTECALSYIGHTRKFINISE